ncbi:hypothetical protein BN1723_019770, partial [Verticillium longisporum]
HHTD